MSDFELTSLDKNSATWVRLSRYMEERIMQLRIQNDGDKNELETAKLRGRIAELKGLLWLDVQPSSDPDRRPE